MTALPRLAAAVLAGALAVGAAGCAKKSEDPSTPAVSGTSAPATRTTDAPATTPTGTAATTGTSSSTGAEATEDLQPTLDSLDQQLGSMDRETKAGDDAPASENDPTPK